MPSPVVMAGLSEEIAPWLRERLSIDILVTRSGRDTLKQMAETTPSLLILGHRLTDLSPLDVLKRVRATARLAKVPIFYCLPPLRDSTLPTTMAEELKVAQLLESPLDREQLVRLMKSILNAPSSQGEATTPEDKARSSVAQVWAKSKPRILERVKELEEIALAAVEGALDRERREQGAKEAHKLVGSLGTFGFMEGSHLAREIEQLLEPSAPFTQEDVLRLSELAVAIREILGRDQVPAQPVAEPPLDHTHPYLLVVDRDPEWAEAFQKEAQARGFQAKVATTLAAANTVLAHGTPAALLLDIEIHGETKEPMELLEEVSTGDQPIPVLAMGTRAALVDRVEVARMGGRGFLPKPATPGQACDAMMQMLERTKSTGSTILAVDDDPDLLSALQALLQARRYRVVTLNEPLKFWETLQEVAPALLMLDVSMPNLNGIELCRVVRNDPRWSRLPILFLTSHRDPDTVNKVFAAGADDYVGKPIVESELIIRIRNRLERAELHRALAENDPLTGLANRATSDQLLNQLIRLAGRQGHPFCLAVLDLDHFKSINDRFGHETGDIVLQGLGTLLRRTFRGEDVVARWGGEEFVLGLYGLSRDQGVHRLAEFLESLREKHFEARDHTKIQVTFSAGVAECPSDGKDLSTLYRAADRALYIAKGAGRDRVLPVGWVPEQSKGGKDVDVVLVEDDEVLVSLLLHAFKTRGYRTHWIKDGLKVIETLGGKSPALRARVVLLDVGLPGMDGLAVLRKLAQDGILEHTRVIMLTARSTEAVVVQALELGAFDHVPKPFSLPVLMNRIRRAFES